MKNISIALIFICVLFSCNIKSIQTENTKISDTIPEGAITFEYDNKMLKMIILKGTLNDSIDVNYVFDTGWTGISISDSLKPNNVKASYLQEPTQIKIHNCIHIYNAIEYFKENHPFTNFYGSSSGIIDWSIFENKIIEISYRYKYIRELPNTHSLQDYDSIKIRRMNKRLIVPVTASYKNKTINDSVIIDTGSNSVLHFSNNLASRYDITMDEAVKVGKSTMANGQKKGFSVTADTIKVGESFVINQSLGFGEINYKYGLLGNHFLENFDVVLDLKNYCLYLKPLNK